MMPASGRVKVLDSWALMAWINGERPAVGKVQALLEEADAGQLDLSMNMVNAGEVYYLLARQHGDAYAGGFWDDLQTTPIRIVDAPNWLILEAARWKSRYRISYADAFAVATAIRERATLVSGDPDFRALSDSRVVDLEWIGA